MENNIPKKMERYIAASCYFFESGYFLSFITKEESNFVKFHFNQAGKLILIFIIPALITLYFGVDTQDSHIQLSQYLGLATIFLLAAYLVFGLIGAYHALKGMQKKII